MVRMVMSTDTLLSLLWSRSVSWLRTMRLFAGDHYRSSLMLRKMQETRVGIFMSQRVILYAVIFFQRSNVQQCGCFWSKQKSRHFILEELPPSRASKQETWAIGSMRLPTSSHLCFPAVPQPPGVRRRRLALGSFQPHGQWRLPQRTTLNANLLGPRPSSHSVVFVQPLHSAAPHAHGGGGCPPPLPLMQGLTLSLWNLPAQELRNWHSFFSHSSRSANLSCHSKWSPWSPWCSELPSASTSEKWSEEGMALKFYDSVFVRVHFGGCEISSKCRLGFLWQHAFLANIWKHTPEQTPEKNTKAFPLKSAIFFELQISRPPAAREGDKKYRRNACPLNSWHLFLPVLLVILGVFRIFARFSHFLRIFPVFFFSGFFDFFGAFFFCDFPNFSHFHQFCFFFFFCNFAISKLAFSS